MINIFGRTAALIGAICFGYLGDLPMVVASLAGVIYFKEQDYD